MGVDPVTSSTAGQPSCRGSVAVIAAGSTVDQRTVVSTLERAARYLERTKAQVEQFNTFDKALALYVHWPFCVSKCPYCDFNSHVRSAIDQDEWREALLAGAGGLLVVSARRREPAERLVRVSLDSN